MGLWFPVVAQASLLSYLFSTPKAVQPAEAKETRTSQTISLMEVGSGVTDTAATGGGDITVVNDSALVPDTSPSGTTADIKSRAGKGIVSLYVVKSGNTLQQIAKMYDVSVNTIVWANDLNPKATLKVGQSLVILPMSGIQHTIKKGETIQSIAKKYKGDVGDILSFNDLTSESTLSIGDVILIPDGVEISTTSGGTTTVTSGLTAARSRLIASYPSYDGYYINPLPTGHKTQGLHANNGIDIGAPKGNLIYAAADGTVVVARYGWNGGYGNYVIIDHDNGTQTLYGHMSVIYATEGAEVSQGEQIGTEGSTGRSTGPHLHFEVHGAKNPF